jgi:D-alanine-D-alanine ligase
MRICILVSAALPEDSPTAAFDPEQAPERWLDGHEVRKVRLHKDEAATRLPALVAEGFDVFLNLCDASAFEPLAGGEVHEALAALGVPYTGPSPMNYRMTRREVKTRLRDAGLPTPAWAFVYAPADLPAALAVPLPAIVKHHDGYGSLGMGRDAKVTDTTQLQERTLEMLRAHGGALVEEFAPGTELTVLCVADAEAPGGVFVYPPFVCEFPPGEELKHFELKWQTFGGLIWRPETDAARVAEATALCRAVFTTLGARCGLRCDLRVDARGRLTLLDCNFDFGVFFPPGYEGCADQILLHDPEGQRGLLRRMFNLALKAR